MSKTLDNTLSALSHAHRRDMLRRLAAGPMRITELSEPYPVTLNAVSKHVKVLETAGLVVRRKVGRDHFVTLNREPLREVAAAMRELEAPVA